MLFNEGFLCYSVGAYRAALLFSYLGLLRTSAHRLMTATRPVDFPEKRWKQIQSAIREDSSWEETIQQGLLLQKPTSLFLLDDDLRAQFIYWRGRRNDAAHARTNEIGAAHVESLWLFVRSNLAKLVVSGGRTGLFERFRRHFDPSFTPRDVDFLHLVREIPQSIRYQEYRDFIHELLRLTDDIDDPYRDDDPELSKSGTLLLRHIDSLQEPRLRQAVVDELRSDQRLLIGALLDTPSLTLYFSHDGFFLRKLWHDVLPFEDVVQGFHPLSRSLGVIAFMLRNALIPESQRNEALDHVLGKLNEGYYHGYYEEDVLTALAPFGFWDLVHRYAFARYSPDWLARNLNLAVDYFVRFPVDVCVARGFAALVPEEPEEDDDYLQNTKFFQPEDAFNLSYYLSDKGEKLKELAEVARANNINVVYFLRLMDPEKDWENNE